MLPAHNKMKNTRYKTIKALNKMSKIAFMKAVLPSIVMFFSFLTVFTGFSFGATGYREDFLSYGPGVAAAGMGDTFVSNGDDLTAGYIILLF